jgi:hypothetical protein
VSTDPARGIEEEQRAHARRFSALRVNANPCVASHVMDSVEREYASCTCDESVVAADARPARTEPRLKAQGQGKAREHVQLQRQIERTELVDAA